MVVTIQRINLAATPLSRFTMKIEEVRGISPSYVQCWSCRNAPILDKEATLGTVSAEVEARLTAKGTDHESRHPGHRVSLFLFIQDLPVEEVKSELPIVREMRAKFLLGQK